MGVDGKLYGSRALLEKSLALLGIEASNLWIKRPGSFLLHHHDNLNATFLMQKTVTSFDCLFQVKCGEKIVFVDNVIYSFAISY